MAPFKAYGHGSDVAGGIGLGPPCPTTKAAPKQKTLSIESLLKRAEASHGLVRWLSHHGRGIVERSVNGIRCAVPLDRLTVKGTSINPIGTTGIAVKICRM
jgi:hypothetical protein